MTITKGLIVVASTSLVCGLVGSAIGFALGEYAPGAYQAFFVHASERARDEFNPIHVGLALGLGQGLLAGLIVGTIIVALVTWYEIRTHVARHNAPELRSALEPRS
ncbi:MAG: hypothetical protein EXS05_17465 [Planctomycetaceae bacterium]|nr:hypothetical protein [Planctomycetaceae bacterium]